MKIVSRASHSQLKDTEGGGPVLSEDPLSQHPFFSLLPPIAAFGGYFFPPLDPNASLLSVFTQVFQGSLLPLGLQERLRPLRNFTEALDVGTEGLEFSLTAKQGDPERLGRGAGQMRCVSGRKLR